MVTLIWLMMASLKWANSTLAKFVAYLSVVRCCQKIYGFVGFHILAVFGFKQFSDIAFNFMAHYRYFRHYIQACLYYIGCAGTQWGSAFLLRGIWYAWGILEEPLMFGYSPTLDMLSNFTPTLSSYTLICVIHTYVTLLLSKNRRYP